MNNFKVIKKFNKSAARTGSVQTPHGSIKTPFFMPIATRGAVKSVDSSEIKNNLKSEILLSNTYHMLLTPGLDILKKFGGLHNFMNWQGPILTDSGGYQVFSLGKHRKITEAGATFKDPKDGKTYTLTPEKVIEIQNIIGSDIMMVLDECTEYPCTKKRARESMELSLRWAQRCKDAHEKLKKKKTSLGKRARKQLLFGIVQGSTYEDLRKEYITKLVAISFDGYAVGGVSVGEESRASYQVLDWTLPYLPDDKPKYLMGMGTPRDIIESVKRGADMFDCVIPTREGRHGRLFVWKNNNLNSKNFYNTINITNAKFKTDKTPINKNSSIPMLRDHSKAYLHHLFKTKELLAYRLASLHNLEFYLDLMKQVRQSIRKGVL